VCVCVCVYTHTHTHFTLDKTCTLHQGFSFHKVHCNQTACLVQQSHEVTQLFEPQFHLITVASHTNCFMH